MDITPQMIRLSIGVEDAQDLIADLARAFAAVGEPAHQPELALA